MTVIHYVASGALILVTLAIGIGIGTMSAAMLLYFIAILILLAGIRFVRNRLDEADAQRWRKLNSPNWE